MVFRLSGAIIYVSGLSGRRIVLSSPFVSRLALYQLGMRATTFIEFSLRNPTQYTIATGSVFKLLNN